ncbi:MAG TPA: hypothetical protein VFV07_13070 [Rhizomicrobium sp.]|nr:hypothetical protein [Rhizomicrobium sp.]
MLAVAAIAMVPQAVAADVFRNKTDGYQIAIPPGWTKTEPPHGQKRGFLVLEPSGTGSTGENCRVGAYRDPGTARQTQDQINAGMRDGTVLREDRASKDKEETVVGGGPMQLAGGIVGLTVDKTRPFSYLLFFRSTMRLRELDVRVPGRGYLVICVVLDADYPSQRKTLDQIFTSFEPVAQK